MGKSRKTPSRSPSRAKPSPNPNRPRGSGRPKGARDKVPRKASGRLPVAVRLLPETLEWLKVTAADLGIGPGELARRVIEWTGRRGIPSDVINAIENR